MDVKVRRQKTIRQGRVFDITVENVTFPNGVNIDMDIIRHPGASAIVPITSNEEVVMIKQYRHAVGGYIWEIPAGTFDGKEDPLVCAQRELIEEVGYKAKTWDAIGVVAPGPGYTDEIIHLFMARDLVPTKQKLDPDEFIELHTVPIKQVISMILEDEIKDGKTITALFRAIHKLRPHKDEKTTNIL